MATRKNLNRGYHQLIVWQDAQTLYVFTCQIMMDLPFELKRIASNQIASVDSVHRNIAEGYCRKGIKEYLKFLYIARASLGESVSGISTYKKAKQISEEDFEKINSLAFKIENGLKRLIESLQYKLKDYSWNDSLF